MAEKGPVFWAPRPSSSDFGPLGARILGPFRVWAPDRRHSHNGYISGVSPVAFTPLPRDAPLTHTRTHTTTSTSTASHEVVIPPWVGLLKHVAARFQWSKD